MMMLIVLASVLTGVSVGMFFGWLEVEDYWDVEDTVTHMVASFFLGALLGLMVGGVICGTVALVRYFI